MGRSGVAVDKCVISMYGFLLFFSDKRLDKKVPQGYF